MSSFIRMASGRILCIRLLSCIICTRSQQNTKTRMQHPMGRKIVSAVFFTSAKPVLLHSAGAVVRSAEAAAT